MMVITIQILKKKFFNMVKKRILKLRPHVPKIGHGFG
jgi:hypothetical protein